MRTLVILFVLCEAWAGAAYAQHGTLPYVPGRTLLSGEVSGLVPSPARLLSHQFAQPRSTSGFALRPTVQADSLPEGMPLNTRLLWGRHGLVRAVGLAPSSREAELRLRRSMLRWHQRLGLLTFGIMTTQVVLGELLAANPAKYYDDLRPAHGTLGYVTFGTYMATAGLSLTAPPARRYTGGFSSVRLHRYLAVVHFAGMLVQPWLGKSIAEASTGDAYDRRLSLHRWTGRITYGAFTAAILSIFLPY